MEVSFRFFPFFSNEKNKNKNWMNNIDVNNINGMNSANVGHKRTMLLGFSNKFKDKNE